MRGILISRLRVDRAGVVESGSMELRGLDWSAARDYT